MARPSASLFIVVAALLILGGCVAKSDYLQKTAEADALARRLEAAAAENTALQVRIGQLAAEKELRAAESKDLQERLKVKSEEMVKTVQQMKNRAAELEGDAQMLKESIDLLKKTKEEAIKTVSSTYEDLLKEMKGEIEQGQVAITELKGKLTVDVVDKILFASGQAEVKPEGLEILKRVVDILRTVTDKTIRIEGHTDNVPIAGALAKRYPTNWELSAARAVNVARYLAKEGLDPSLLSAAAYGQYQPVADNETPEGRAKNRRIAIILLPKEESTTNEGTIDDPKE
ncbi:MAG: OmpA family protein [Deltaproteobacteria bacterium]|nr:OmpA family protein [Deltaproteobacteria bacterium]